MAFQYKFSEWLSESENIDKVFVYGTLRDPETRKRALGENVPTEKAEAKGEVKEEGEYSTIHQGDGVVRGEVMRLTKSQIKKLDDWENEYTRHIVYLKDGSRAYAYSRKPEYNSNGKKVDELLSYDKFLEHLLHVDLDEYAHIVADVYHKLPIFDKSAIPNWKALNYSNHKFYKMLQSRVKVVFVTGEPYETQAEMREDYLKNKRLLISKDNSEHPYFSVEDNCIFRTVHDFIVHIQNNTPFGLKGEMRAANYHMHILSKEAKVALFTEVVGQVACIIADGKFPVQKVAVMNGFDYDNIGKLDNRYVFKHGHLKMAA